MESSIEGRSYLECGGSVNNIVYSFRSMTGIRKLLKKI